MNEKNIEELQVELKKKDEEIKTLQTCEEYYRKKSESLQEKLNIIKSIIKL